VESDVHAKQEVLVFVGDDADDGEAGEVEGDGNKSTYGEEEEEEEEEDGSDSAEEDSDDRSSKRYVSMFI
jgi:hypothetical protein